MMISLALTQKRLETRARISSQIVLGLGILLRSQIMWTNSWTRADMFRRWMSCTHQRADLSIINRLLCTLFLLQTTMERSRMAITMRAIRSKNIATLYQKGSIQEDIRTSSRRSFQLWITPFQQAERSWDSMISIILSLKERIPKEKSPKEVRLRYLTSKELNLNPARLGKSIITHL